MQNELLTRHDEQDAPAEILEKFSDAGKVLGHIFVVTLQCAPADFNELGIAPQALNLNETIRKVQNKTIVQRLHT